MLRCALGLLGVALATSAPIIDLSDLFGDSCTGADDPKDAPPICYTGKVSVLGGAFSEGITIELVTVDHDKQTGTMNIHATGVQPEDCKNLAFTKNGQDISFDQGCLGTVKITAQYCSDQDQVQLHAAIPHFPIASIPATLRRDTCP